MLIYWSTFLLVLHAAGASSADVTYEDLEELDAVCHTLDTCKIRRRHDSLDQYTCHCNRDCYVYGTCCVDARSRNRKPPRRKQSCRSLNENQLSYFMVDYCPSSSNRNSIYATMCEEEQKKDDLMSLVPVTSLSTNRTYKNYFCFRCNEVTERFLYWNIKMNANGDSTKQTMDVIPTYDGAAETWTAPIGTNGEDVPISLTYEIAEEETNLPKICVPDAISNCSARYRNRDTKRKCEMYTSYIYVIKRDTKVAYRNPHCALCNFESLEKMECGVQTGVRISQKRPFSFTQLLDINQRDGDKVGMIIRCDADSTWDPFFKICRKLKCALPGYTIKNGKCVAP